MLKPLDKICGYYWQCIGQPAKYGKSQVVHGPDLIILRLYICAVQSEDHDRTFPHGIDKSAVDDLIRQTYADRSSMLKNFSQLFFHKPEKLSAEFNIWNLSLGLAVSAYATIHCAVELRDADLRKDLSSIETPTLILHGTDDRICVFDLAKKMNEGVKESQLVAVEVQVMVLL